MSETRIKIKELEMNGETAIRIAECLKKHEPEIWKVLSEELKQALRILDVIEQSEQIPNVYKTELSKVKQLGQTQTSLNEQLQILRPFANKLGLYDAADYLLNVIVEQREQLTCECLGLGKITQCHMINNKWICTQCNRPLVGQLPTT